MLEKYINNNAKLLLLSISLSFFQTASEVAQEKRTDNFSRRSAQRKHRFSAHVIHDSTLAAPVSTANDRTTYKELVNV